MADVFNKTPTEYVDLNTMFPELNEKIGLTYEQWRKAIENINFVKNNLGISEIKIGIIKKSFTTDPYQSELNISPRELIVNGQHIVYLDFDIKFPVGAVSSVNGKTGDIEITADDIGAVIANALTLSGFSKISNDYSGITLEYESGATGVDEYRKVALSSNGVDIEGSGSLSATSGTVQYPSNLNVDWNGSEINFNIIKNSELGKSIKNIAIDINGIFVDNKKVATIDDIANAITSTLNTAV